MAELLSKEPEPMNIVQWFDPTNKEHLRAWQHLQTQGSWPVEFIPGDVTFPTLWQASIAWKMADLYLASALAALPSAQEPVAWRITATRASDGYVTIYYSSTEANAHAWAWHAYGDPNYRVTVEPLYTAPPPPEAMLKELEEFRRVYPTLEDNELRQAIDALLSAKT